MNFFSGLHVSWQVAFSWPLGSPWVVSRQTPSLPHPNLGGGGGVGGGGGTTQTAAQSEALRPSCESVSTQAFWTQMCPGGDDEGARHDVLQRAPETPAGSKVGTQAPPAAQRKSGTAGLGLTGAQAKAQLE